MPESSLPVLIVGDVHGDLERLFGALRSYPAESWQTIFLGDLVDGGPFGVGAMRYARDRANSTVLIGNHEVAMLKALRDRASIGSWMAIGGQLHDLEELRRDLELQAWIRSRPALVCLPDRTLVQHTDSDAYGRLIDADDRDPIRAVNREVARLLQNQGEDLLWTLLSARNVFRRNPMRLRAWLTRTGAARVAHGHTPHSQSNPEIYLNGLAIDFDGGLSRFRPSRFRGARPYAASVAPLPSSS